MEDIQEVVSELIKCELRCLDIIYNVEFQIMAQREREIALERHNQTLREGH